ncbi:MAG: hypothetical protein ACM3Y9_17010 [Ignavibacteria bacterium]
MKRAFCIIGLCLVAGCSSGYQWSKRGMTPATREADLMACGTKNAHLQKDDPSAVVAIDQCMMARGYEKTQR